MLLSEDAQRGSREALEVELRELVDQVNAALDPHEQLQCVVVVKDPWTTDNGLLTPTMKIRRNLIEQRYESKLARWFQTRRLVIWED